MKTYKDLMSERKFNFKATVKMGMLEPSDEKHIDTLKKRGWVIDEFNLTSSGYELTIKKGSNKAMYSDRKDPRKALETAAKKAR
mgnify:CR=1 FL=1|tara:strand:- start:204 stop:455 length:252 start_codon:yes stop_codon:yes gene_type:complete